MCPAGITIVLSAAFIIVMAFVYKPAAAAFIVALCLKELWRLWKYRPWRHNSLEESACKEISAYQEIGCSSEKERECESLDYL